MRRPQRTLAGRPKLCRCAASLMTATGSALATSGYSQHPPLSERNAQRAQVVGAHRIQLDLAGLGARLSIKSV